ncbi:MAG: hypothetical protein LUC47_08770 [Clostridiales bacterium]|nr:hypothetical protein [Clostridiales bacterium]
MSDEMRSIGFLCPKCRQSVIVERSAFSLTAAPTKIACPCGGSEVRIDYEGDRFRVEAPCVACGGKHIAYCPEKNFLHQKALGFSCGKTGLDCCYVGQDEAVYQAIKRLEEAVDELDEKQEESSFLNDVVMAEVLGELKDIAARGGISCACGSQDWTLKVHYSSVEVVCAHCGASLRLPAATLDDLNDLCCRDKLLIRPSGR